MALSHAPHARQGIDQFRPVVGPAAEVHEEGLAADGKTALLQDLRGRNVGRRHVEEQLGALIRLDQGGVQEFGGSGGVIATWARYRRPIIRIASPARRS